MTRAPSSNRSARWPARGRTLLVEVTTRRCRWTENGEPQAALAPLWFAITQVFRAWVRQLVQTQGMEPVEIRAKSGVTRMSAARKS